MVGARIHKDTLNSINTFLKPSLRYLNCTRFEMNALYFQNKFDGLTVLHTGHTLTTGRDAGKRLSQKVI